MASSILSDYSLFNDWLDAPSLPVIDSPPGLSSSGSSQSDFHSQNSLERYQGSGVDPNFNFRYYTPLELDTSFPPSFADPSLLAQLQQERSFFTSTPGPFNASDFQNSNSSNRALSSPFRSTSSPVPPGLFDQPRRAALKDITNFFPDSYQPYSLDQPSFPSANNVSPVIRAHQASPFTVLSPERNPPSTTPSFLERIQLPETQELSSTVSSPDRPLAEALQENMDTFHLPLRSPYLSTPRKNLYKARNKRFPTSPQLLSPLLGSPGSRRTTHFTLVTPQKQSTRSGPSSPLTPLTPLSDVSVRTSPKQRTLRFRAVSNIKKKKSSRLLSRSSVPQMLEVSEDESSSPSPSPSSADEEPPSTQENAEAVPTEPIFTNREYTIQIEISPEFPMFYRRFPVSSYTDTAANNRRCPGGVYNSPRSPLDLYTPRFVKGKGAEKVGLCPICVEPHARGGINKKVWLAMKFSAFNYHMQYAHGISAATGRAFSPPLAFRVTQRPNAGKKERSEIKEGKCHKCAKWVLVEGVKDVESKVKEIYWWKHAASCHHHTTIENENDIYEKDEVYQKYAQN